MTKFLWRVERTCTSSYRCDTRQYNVDHWINIDSNSISFISRRKNGHCSQQTVWKDQTLTFSLFEMSKIIEWFDRCYLFRSNTDRPWEFRPLICTLRSHRVNEGNQMARMMKKKKLKERKKTTCDEEEEAGAAEKEIRAFRIHNGWWLHRQTLDHQPRLALIFLRFLWSIMYYRQVISNEHSVTKRLSSTVVFFLSFPLNSCINDRTG